MRPADAIETAECWQLALEAKKAPTVLALDAARTCRPSATRATATSVRRGAYILAGDASAPVRLIASGSEVQLALGARDLLAKDGIQAAVVSDAVAGSCSLRKTKHIASKVLGADGTVRVACEAASGFGWERWLGARRRVRRHEGLRRVGARRPTSTSISASPPRRSRKRRGERAADNGGRHGCSGCNQRLRSHRPQRHARHHRIGPQGHRGRGDQRSRPGRDQRPSLPLRHRARPLQRRGARSTATRSMSAAAR